MLRFLFKLNDTFNLVIFLNEKHKEHLGMNFIFFLNYQCRAFVHQFLQQTPNKYMNLCSQKFGDDKIFDKKKKKKS